MSPERRAALVRGLPAFAALPAAVVADLAGSMEERRLPAGAAVVRQGEAGDRLYVIAEGRAEAAAAGPGGGAVPLAALGPGELFGELALLEPAARRHATVTALTPLVLLALPRPAFEALLAAHPGLRATLDDARRRLLTVRFLKVASPFAALPDAALKRLAERVGRVSVPAGAVVVRQGERGDAAYLVASGRVEVVEEPAGAEAAARRLAELGTGALFGEAALLTEAPRCATVRALEPTELLALGRDDLLRAMAQDRAAGDEVVRLLRLRERPRRAAGVAVFERATPEGEVLRILKNPARGAYYRLSPRGWFVWERLDGGHDLRDLTLEYFAAFRVFAPEQVAGIVAGLSAAGFVETRALAPDVAERRAANPTLGERALRLARGVLARQVTIGAGVDDAVGRLYRAGFHLLYRPAAQALLAAVAVAGLAAFAAMGPRADAALRDPAGDDLLWLLAPMLLLALLAHEAGHALTVKAFGREVPRVGIGWYWFGPIAFADTSDMWLADRWPRVAVGLAGVYVNAVLAGAAALAVPLVDDPAPVALLWQFALLSYGGVLFNLNPLLEYDGYHVLCDLIDRPNLRRRAMAALGRAIAAALGRGGPTRRPAGDRVELLYGAGAVLYVAVMAGLLVGVYRPVLEGWIAGAAAEGVAAAVAWVVTVLIAGLSAVAVAAELRGAWRRSAGSAAIV